MNTCEIELTVDSTIEVVDPTQFVTYYVGSGIPSNDFGNDGDIYLRVIEDGSDG